MRKRLLFSLLLFALLVVTAGFIFFTGNSAPGPEVTPVSNLDPQEISRIVVQRNKDVDLEFSREGTRWFMVSPVTARAADSRIRAILGITASRSFARVDRHDALLETFELEPATITLSLDSYNFAFGTTDPLDERRYVMFKDQIHLINDSLFHQLMQPVMFYISARLVPEEETIISIRYNDVLLEKTGNSWKTSLPGNAIDADHLQQIATTWQQGKAREVQEYSRADINDRIILSFISGRSALFDVVSIEPGLVLGRADLALQYHIDRQTSDNLFLPGRVQPNE